MELAVNAGTGMSVQGTTSRLWKKVAALFTCVVAAVTMCTCLVPSHAYAAGTRTVSRTNYVAGSSGGHLWARDTIQFKCSNGRIVSKPTAKQTASAICQIQKGIRGPVYGCYFKQKSPKVSYSKNAKTATVTTYWTCKQGVSFWKLSIDWHKTCTVTYKCNGNGSITVSKKVGKLQLG